MRGQGGEVVGEDAGGAPAQAVVGGGEGGQQFAVRGVGVGGVDLAQAPGGGALHEFAGIFQELDQQRGARRHREASQGFGGGLADQGLVGSRGGFHLAQHGGRRRIP